MKHFLGCYPPRRSKQRGFPTGLSENTITPIDIHYPISPKTLQSMSFAEVDVKGTLAEGSQQMSRVYGRGKIGYYMDSTAEGCRGVIIFDRSMVLRSISLTCDCSHPDIFSSTHCFRNFACWFSRSTRCLKANKRYPASFKTPLLKPLASALRAYFFKSPIQSSSSHPAEKRGFSPYNGNGNPSEIIEGGKKKVQCRAHNVMHKA